MRELRTLISCYPLLAYLEAPDAPNAVVIERLEKAVRTAITAVSREDLSLGLVSLHKRLSSVKKAEDQHLCSIDASHRIRTAVGVAAQPRYATFSLSLVCTLASWQGQANKYGADREIPLVQCAKDLRAAVAMDYRYAAEVESLAREWEMCAASNVTSMAPSLAIWMVRIKLGIPTATTFGPTAGMKMDPRK